MCVYPVWERIGLTRAMDAEGNEHRQDRKFTMNGRHSVTDADIGATEAMRLCLAENDRRFGGYDSRLLRPETMPKLVRFVLRFMRVQTR